MIFLFGLELSLFALEFAQYIILKISVLHFRSTDNTLNTGSTDSTDEEVKHVPSEPSKQDPDL